LPFHFLCPIAQTIEVTDLETGNTTLYNSMSEAARALNLALTSIHRYLATGKVYKKQYIFTKVSAKQL
jgi:hypothetical protein